MYVCSNKLARERPDWEPFKGSPPVSVSPFPATPLLIVQRRAISLDKRNKHIIMIIIIIIFITFPTLIFLSTEKNTITITM